jgi:hypothetical protein
MFEEIAPFHLERFDFVVLSGYLHVSRVRRGLYLECRRAEQ